MTPTREQTERAIGHLARALIERQCGHWQQCVEAIEAAAEEVGVGTWFDWTVSIKPNLPVWDEQLRGDLIRSLNYIDIDGASSAAEYMRWAALYARGLWWEQLARTEVA